MKKTYKKKKGIKKADYGFESVQDLESDYPREIRGGNSLLTPEQIQQMVAKGTGASAGAGELGKALSSTAGKIGAIGGATAGGVGNMSSGTGTSITGGGLGGANAIFQNLAQGSSLRNENKNMQRLVKDLNTYENPYKRGVGAKAALTGIAGGAQAGMQLGGPAGAAVGGALGLASGIYKGVQNARNRKEFDIQNKARIKQKGFDEYYEGTGAYDGLKYNKGTKYKSKVPNIEFEGGEPIFSPKKKDGTRDLLYYDENGPKHSEGGIPARVVAKRTYKKLNKGAKVIQTPDAGPIDIIDIPVGSAIVTAKKDMGAKAVDAHLNGDIKTVEKIIANMPNDYKKKKADGDKETKTPTSAKSRKGTTHSTTETEANRNLNYLLKNLTPEEAKTFNENNKIFTQHQNVLSQKRAKLGRDLTAAEQKQALDEYNASHGTNLSVESYNNALNNIDTIAQTRGADINLRGNVEGRTAPDQTGMFGWRNASARFGYTEAPVENINDYIGKTPAQQAAMKETTEPQTTPTGQISNQGRVNTGGLSLRASDVNNIYQGLRAPEIETLERTRAVPYSYYDLSDPSRRRSNFAARAATTNAINLSGGSAGNVRANTAAAYAANAQRQQDINANELARFDQIKNMNAANRQNVINANVEIANREKEINAANRQATRDQLQTGLVGFDENNYRNRVTNEQRMYDLERNQIEQNKLNLLKGYAPNYQVNPDFNINFKSKKGIKRVYKPKS